MEQAHSSDLRLYWSPKWVTCFQHEKHSCSYQNCSQHHPIAQSCSHGLVCCATQPHFLWNTVSLWPLQTTQKSAFTNFWIHLVKTQERGGQVTLLWEDKALSYTVKLLPCCLVKMMVMVRGNAVITQNLQLKQCCGNEVANKAPLGPSYKWQETPGTAIPGGF